MTILIKILLLILSYLVGAIPFGLIFGLIKGHDIRNEGSGNIGATNVGRILGKKYAIITYLLDMFKGFIFVFLFRYGIIPGEYCLLNPMLYGLVACIGHSYSIFMKFKGGKGVSCGCGAVTGYFYHFLVPILIVFFIIKKISKIVSISSLMTSIFIFIMALSMSLIRGEFLAENIGPYYPLNYTFLILLILIIGVVYVRHIDNIKRIIKKEETPSSY